MTSVFVGARGLLGVFTGGLTSAAAGITAAMFAGALTAVLSRPQKK